MISIQIYETPFMTINPINVQLDFKKFEHVKTISKVLWNQVLRTQLII